MARPKLDVGRVQLSMKIKEHILKYVKVKAATLGINTNILIEDAMAKFLGITQQMDKFDIYALVASLAKTKRVPLTTMINDDILTGTKVLAKRIGVAFAQVVEAAIIDVIHCDMAAIRAGTLKSEAIEGAYIQFLNVEFQNGREVIEDIVKKLAEVQKDNQ